MTRSVELGTLTDGAGEPNNQNHDQPDRRTARGSLTLAAPEVPLEDIASRVSRADTTVLITGQTGVGKGRLARWIHDHSTRADRAFVPVNCGAIPESLIDSQLFGHARGAFSGAARDHDGLVRAANGGTLLLDEVGELPPHAQVRLLRLLEERDVQPVGFERPITVDVRVIAATNRDLTELVSNGSFREDLYYRLDIIRLDIPDLARRRADIPGMVAEFNAEFASIYRQSPLVFSDAAMDAIVQHPWPGNVRQLRTVVERLHVLCAGQRITTEDLAMFGQLRSATPAAQPTRRSLDEIRSELARETVDACRGIVSDAATALGVHRSTIYRWLQTA